MKNVLLGLFGCLCLIEQHANAIDCLEFAYNPPTSLVDGFYGGIDYLYFKSDALVNWATTVQIDSTVVQTQTVDIKPVNFNWDSGYRIEVGYRLPCDRYSVQVNWTQFQTDINHHGVGAYNSTTLGNFYIPAIGFYTPTLPDLSSGNVITGTDLTFNGRFSYNQLDFFLKREFYVGPCVRLAPYGGFKYLLIQQRYSENLIGTINGTTSQSIQAPVTLPDQFFIKFTATDKFTGFGITTGLQAFYDLFYNLTLEARGGLSLLISRTDLHFIEQSNDSNDFIPTNLSSRFNELSFTLDGGFYLAWHQPVFNSCGLLKLKAGWEGHYIPDQNRLPTPDFSNRIPSEPLTLQGLVVGISLDL